MVERVTFPQTGDKNDAEYFAALAGQDNITDFVERGMGFTVDYTVPEVTIGSGKAFVNLSSDSASTSGGTVLDLNRMVQMPETTESLTDNAVNHIYLETRYSNDDDANFEAYTDTSNAASDSLKIGEIDTSSNTKDEQNRLPDVDSNQLSNKYQMFVAPSNDANAMRFRGVTGLTGGPSQSTRDEAVIVEPPSGASATRRLLFNDGTGSGDQPAYIGRYNSANNESNEVLKFTANAIALESERDGNNLRLQESGTTSPLATGVTIESSDSTGTKTNRLEVESGVDASNAVWKNLNEWHILEDDVPIKMGSSEQGKIEYLSGIDHFAIDTASGGTTNVILRAKGNDHIQLRGSSIRLQKETDIRGNVLRGLGGTSDAGSGALRFANNSFINWRNSGDTGDIGMRVSDLDDFIINHTGTDEFVVTGGTTINVKGNNIIGVGGTTDSSTGSIRLGSGTQPIYARDATNSRDYGIAFKENSGSPVLDVNSTDIRINDGELKLLSESTTTHITSYQDDISNTWILGVFDGFDSLSHAQFIGRRARGSQSSPASIQDGDTIFGWEAEAHDGSGFANAFRIGIEADGSISDGTVPSRAIFKTGSSSGSTEQALILDSSQNATLPNGSLGIENGNGTEIITLKEGLSDNGGEIIVSDNNGNTTAILQHFGPALDITDTSDIQMGGGNIQGVNAGAGFEPRKLTANDLGDTNTEQLSGETEPVGYGAIQDATNGHTAFIRFDGSSANVSIVDQDGSHFTTTSGNSGTINVFHDGSDYVVENQTGKSASIAVELMHNASA